MSWVSVLGEGFPLVVSYHTGGLYEMQAWELLRSCQAQGLGYHIAGLPDQGSWEKNTGYKPTFLLEMSKRYKARRLLWLDADARVRARPALLEHLDVPVAYHTWQGVEVLSGTILLGTGRDRVLEAWRDVIRKSPGSNDQTCLGIATCEKHYELPVEYAYIYDQVFQKPDQLSDPVIEHMQVSRWAKKLVRL